LKEGNSFAREKMCYLHPLWGGGDEKERDMKRGGEEAVRNVWV